MATRQFMKSIDLLDTSLNTSYNNALHKKT